VAGSKTERAQTTAHAVRTADDKAAGLAPVAGNADRLLGAPRPARFLDQAVRFASVDDGPRAFLERCLDALKVWEPKIGAFVHLNIDAARAAADRSNARWLAGALASHSPPLTACRSVSKTS
jgi:hypothetical protein